MLLTVLLSFFILMFLHTKGYCTDGSSTSTVVPSEGTDTGAFQFDNNYLTLRAMQEQVQQDFITRMYALYDVDPEGTKTFAQNILNSINQDGSTYRGFYIEEGVGGSQFKIHTYFYNSLYFGFTGAYTTANTSFVNIPYMTGTFYERSISSNGSFVSTGTQNTLNVPYPFLKVFVPEFRDMFIDFGVVTTADTEVLERIETIIQSYKSEFDEIQRLLASIENELKSQNSSINTQNQLQKDNNDLQKEQNNFLKDDNVNTDGLQFATDDTVNPTSDGFNNLFMSIYNAFCNTSSAPLTITLPYVNETFTIQPNLVSNAMQKAGLGFVATLIHSFYYYSVCLFIYKDINKIIEHLKSGNLTADCGNVKTEVL